VDQLFLIIMHGVLNMSRAFREEAILKTRLHSLYMVNNYGNRLLDVKTVWRR
jgi:hypothetical protein